MPANLTDHTLLLRIPAPSSTGSGQCFVPMAAVAERSFPALTKGKKRLSASPPSTTAKRRSSRSLSATAMRQSLEEVLTRATAIGMHVKALSELQELYADADLHTTQGRPDLSRALDPILR